LLFAGTWIKRKGIDDLVTVFASLAEQYPDLELAILGAGTPAHIVRAAFPRNIAGRVTCWRSSSDDETAAMMARADVFLLPSLFEGTPLTMIEAMMSGLPIVTTATCGMKDVIAHGRTGLLAPTHAPAALAPLLSDLLEHESHRERLGREAQREASARYTWPLVAAPVLETYQRLIERATASEHA
jgi:glycosyltransferase involved in cell wall biosynthesis